jgi:hypothetical protein
VILLSGAGSRRGEDSREAGAMMPYRGMNAKFDFSSGLGKIGDIDAGDLNDVAA